MFIYLYIHRLGMEQYTKVRKIVEPSGNAGHIYLPKQMIGKEVVVLIPKRFELNEIFSLLKGDLGKIMGVYLVGSYARGENKQDSDIDILVVTDGNCEIKSDELDIFCLKYQENKPIPLSAKSMLQEAKPILNSRLLQELKDRPFSYSMDLDIGKSALKIAKDLLKMSGSDEEIGNGIVYSLVLRLKTYLIYKCLKNDTQYSTKLLLEELGKYIHNPNLMLEIYRAERDNNDLGVKIRKGDVENLLKALLKMYK